MPVVDEEFGGTYILAERLGVGGMGEVWRAIHTEFQENRAIKIILGEFADDPELRRQFIREARNALLLVGYPNIVRIFDLSVHKGMPFIAMEYIKGAEEGRDLEKLIRKRKKFSLAETGDILDQIAGALDITHRQNLAHLDLKPANILVERVGDHFQLKLSDFGLTTELKEIQQKIAEGGYATGGTPLYMAPEQWRHRPGKSSDIYSLGAIVYELLAGQPPFVTPPGLGRTERLNILLDLHQNYVPHPLSRIDPAIPPEIDRVVLKALDKKAEGRYATAGEMALAYRQTLLATGANIGRTEFLVAEQNPTIPLNNGSTARPLFRPFSLKCPYKGLRSFEYADSAFFFGRESFTAELLKQIKQNNLVALVGPSGSGKSSVINAGVLPVLKEQASWLVLTLRPGYTPLFSLARAIIPYLEKQLSEVDRLAEINKLAGRLYRGEVSLHQIIEVLSQHNPVENILVVVDQFEELYTLCQDEHERVRFQEELVKSGPLCKRLITLRADFMGYLLAYRPLADALQGHDVKLSPMNREELLSAVEKPATICGIALEKGLADNIVDGVLSSPGDLPLLEFALAELWEHQENGLLTHAAYQQIGGVKGALIRYADRVLAGFTPPEQQSIRQILLKLVRPGQGTEDTRRVATRDELGDYNWTLVNRLAEMRLLVTSRDNSTGRQTAEVVHEALIRNWPALRSWIDGDRKFLLWQEELNRQVGRWEENDRNKDRLLQGTAQLEAEHYFGEEGRIGPLSPAARDFIKAGTSQRRKRSRNRWVLLSGVLAITTSLTILALFWAFQADTKSKEAQQAATTAEIRRQEAQSNRLAAQSLGISQSQPDLAILLSLAANKISDTTESRGAFLDSLISSQNIEGYLRGHTGRVYGVAFSPDGKTLASAGEDNTVRLWNLEKKSAAGKPLTGHTRTVLAVSFSPDGKTLASGGIDQKIILWDTASGSQKLVLEGHTGLISNLAFTPDGRYLFSGSYDKTIKVWDLSLNPPLSAAFQGHSEGITAIAYNQQTGLLASVDKGGTLVLWNARTAAVVKATGNLSTINNCLSFSPDGKNIALGSGGENVGIYSVPDLTAEYSLKGHQSAVSCATYSPGGEFLVSVGADKQVIIWDGKTYKQLGEGLLGHSAAIWSASVSSGGKIATASFDGTVILWKPISRPLLFDRLYSYGENKLENTINSLALSSDKKFLAFGDATGQVNLVDNSDYSKIAFTFSGHTAPVNSVVFSPDSKILASAGDDRTIRLWDVAGHKPLHDPLTHHTGTILQLAFSPDGKMLALASADGTVIVWDTTSWQVLGSPLTGFSQVLSVAFSPDGKLLATGGQEDGHTVQKILLWDTTNFKTAGTPLLKHTGTVISLAFSPDGKSLVSGGAENNLIIWDVATQTPRVTLEGHTSSVTAVAFSPNGKIIASASLDRTWRFWDATSGLPLSQPVHNPTLNSTDSAGTVGGYSALAFSQNGKFLFMSTLGYRDIQSWKVDLEDLKNEACHLAGRDLSREEWNKYLETNQPFETTCAANT